MDLMVLDEEARSGWISYGRTQHWQIKRPRGVQLVIMWFPRNPKWKILATHD